MGKLRVWFLVLLFALVASASAAAALGTVSLSRTVTAGSVLADNNANVSVYFEDLVTTGDIMTVNATTGEVSFDLTALMPADGYNTEAQYTFGSESVGVFAITNNSGVDVSLSFSSSNAGLTLGQVGNATSIGAGDTEAFYFELDTTGINAGSTEITATITVSSN